MSPKRAVPPSRPNNPVTKTWAGQPGEHAPDSRDSAVDPDGWIVRMPNGVMVGVAEALLRGPSGAQYIAIRLDRREEVLESSAERVLVPLGCVSLGPSRREVILCAVTPTVCALLPVYRGEPITARDEALILWRCVLGTADDGEIDQEMGESADRDIVERLTPERSEKGPPARVSRSDRTRVA